MLLPSEKRSEEWKSGHRGENKHMMIEVVPTTWQKTARESCSLSKRRARGGGALARPPRPGAKAQPQGSHNGATILLTLSVA